MNVIYNYLWNEKENGFKRYGIEYYQKVSVNCLHKKEIEYFRKVLVNCLHKKEMHPGLLLPDTLINKSQEIAFYLVFDFTILTPCKSTLTERMINCKFLK